LTAYLRAVCTLVKVVLRLDPTPATATLNAAVRAALADATVRKRFADQGQDIPPTDQQTPEALAAQQKAEIEKWWPIIRSANLKNE
jgi:tripartite-type tricarboxylate transporter receptor subunit TctC